MSLVNIDNTIVDCVLVNNAEKYIIEKNPGPKQAAKKQLTKMANKNKQVNTAKNQLRQLRAKAAADRQLALIPRIKTSPAQRAARADLEAFVKNVLTVDKPFVVPRDVATNVAVKKFDYAHKIVPQANQSQGAFMVRPNAEAFLSIAAQVDDTVPNYAQNNPEAIADYTYNTVVGAIMSFDQSLHLLDKTVVKSSTATGGIIGYHFSATNKKLTPGLKYYPGTWQFDSSQGLTFNVKNTCSSSQSYSALAGYIDLNGTAVLSHQSVAVSVPKGATSTITVSSASAADFYSKVANPSVSKGFWMAVQNANLSPVKMPSGFDIYVNNNLPYMLTGLVWKHYTLWDVLGVDSVIARAQYENCSRSCVTACRATFSNFSNLFAKGGIMYAAQFPGDSFQRIPGNIDEMIAVISSQTKDKLETSDLTLGSSWSFKPEKIQDWYFEASDSIDPYNGSPRNLPFFVGVWDVKGLDVTPVFNIHGSIVMELLSTDISLTYFNPPVVPGAQEQLLAMLSQINTVTTNDFHVRDIAKQVHKVLSSEAFQDTASKVFNTGLKISPAAIGALLSFL